MSFNQSTIDFLKEIKEEKNISHLAREMGLTERSLRYKIEEINEVIFPMMDREILVLENSNLSINGDIDNILDYISGLHKNEYTFIQSEREEVLLIYILYCQEKIILDDFQEILDVSRSTLKKDLKNLKEKYQKLGLEIKSSSRYGLEFVGEELSIRKIMLKKCLDYLNFNEEGSVTFKKSHSFSNKIIEKVMYKFFSDSEISDIESYIRTLESETSKTITDDAFRTLIFYINILLKRTKNGKKIVDMNNKNFILETEEFKIIKNNIAMLDKKFDLGINELELLKLTEYFLGSHSYNPKFSFYENWINLEIIANKIIKSVSDILRVDFTEDTELAKGIINHLLPTIYRIQNNISFQKSDISKEVKSQYKDIFYAVKNSIEILENYTEKEMPDDEISYLVVHFKLSLKKIERNSSNRKRILLVCGLGYGTSNLLKQELEELYNVDIVDVIPLNRLKFYNTEGIHLIVSTVRLSVTNMRTVIVNPVLTNGDKEALLKNGLTNKVFNLSVESMLDVVSKSCEIKDRDRLIRDLKGILPSTSDSETAVNPSLLEVLPFKNFKVVEGVKNWEEAVKVSAEILLNNGYIEENYVDSMINTIKKLGPYMVIGKKIILPHAENNNNIHRTGMSFLKLIDPVEFPEGIKINYVVTLSVKEEREHIDALLQLKKMIDKYNFIDRIQEFEAKEDIFGEFSYLFEKFLRD